jgi:long-chain acyl-CoA synthetase
MARYATSLHKKFGLKPNDVVAAMLPNSPEFAVVAFGTLQAGCVLTTLNPIYKEREYPIIMNVFTLRVTSSYL